MKARTFFFPDRVGRLEYLARYLPPNIGLAYLLSNQDPGGWVIVLALVVSLALIPFALLPRIRDCAVSNWVLILAFVPVFDRALGVILLFKSGVPYFIKPDPPQATELTPPTGRSSFES